MDLTPLMKPGSVAVVGASPRMNRATRVITDLQRFGRDRLRALDLNPLVVRDEGRGVVAVDRLIELA
jgi:hypothetical protein